MRILMASDFYAPFIGGSERQVQLLGKELVRRGHEVGVATVWHVGLPECQTDFGMSVHRLKGLVTRSPRRTRDQKRRYHPPFPDPGIVWRLRRLVRQYQPDVMHAHGWIAYSCAVALIGTDIPLLISARDYGYSCAIRTLLHRGRICDGPAPGKCVRCASHSYEVPKALVAVAGVLGGRGLLTWRTAAIHSISTFVEQIVWRDLLAPLGHGPQPQTVIIHDPADTGCSAFAGERTPDHPCLARLPTEPYILFVGALQAHKGLQPLLAAYERLAAPPPLVLIGTVWPDTPRTFPEGVVVLHNIPHRQVMTAWERCLFAVAPSVWAEPLGGVITEAMSKGKAVITSDVGGPVDIVVPDQTGLLVPPGDVKALAAAIRRLSDDAELRERLGRAGRERVQLFAAHAVIPRFEALYQQLVDEPHLCTR